MAHVNWGPSPLLPFYRWWVQRQTEYAVFEPSILEEFDRWFLWAKCKHSGVPIEEWKNRDLLMVTIRRKTRRLIESMERHVMEHQPQGVFFRTELPNGPLPCYSPKGVIINSTT